MTPQRPMQSAIFGIASLCLLATSADAHKLREQGLTVKVADSEMSITPSRAWNRLSGNSGKNTESWTLDGGQLNDVTFYGGIEAGKPLIRERHKKRDPLPKFTSSTLPVEIPELLEGTYRTDKGIGAFQVLAIEPTQFLGSAGVKFSYSYTDGDELVRKGEARGAVIRGKLYMITFDAPRLHYFDRTIADFRKLADTATMK